MLHLHESALPGAFPDPDNPTFDQAATEIAKHIDRSEALVGDETVYVSFAPTSSNGQRDSEVQALREGYLTDFQEQALLYEAFFDVIAERDWIDGALVGILDWFDQYARPPEQWYYDQTDQGSPRSKPAEEVIRLWFDAD